MVRADGSPVVLEVNTLPGMTETSLLPKAAAAAGIELRRALPADGGLGAGTKTVAKNAEEQKCRRSRRELCIRIRIR